MVFTPAVYAEKRIFGTITLPRAKSIFKAEMLDFWDHNPPSRQFRF